MWEVHQVGKYLAYGNCGSCNCSCSKRELDVPDIKLDMWQSSGFAVPFDRFLTTVRPSFRWDTVPWIRGTSNRWRNQKSKKKVWGETSVTRGPCDSTTTTKYKLITEIRNRVRWEDGSYFWVTGLQRRFCGDKRCIVKFTLSFKVGRFIRETNVEMIKW